jgi:glycosyltransferase involved in cell wall biosynthesis
MNYAPNVDAVLWFADKVWPLVRSSRPDAKFVIIGATPTAAVRRLASADAGIEVTGSVPEVASHLAKCAVAVAPLHISRGVQNKVLEALSLGLPTVLTSAVADGLPPVALTACRVADEPAGFARHVLELLALGTDERRALAACANLDSLAWPSQLSELPSILAGASFTGSTVAQA